MSETIKVVINACFGGFGLSHAAERELIGCGHVELMEPEKYYGERDGWEKRFADDQARGDRLSSVNVVDGKIVIDNHRDAANRACPRLVEVVERMGEAANSWAADLRVVEVPAGVEWGIHDYDGREHVEESHRTWY